MKKTVVSLLFAIGASAVTPFAMAKAPAELAARFDYPKGALKAAAGGTFAKAKCCNVTEWMLSTPEGETIELTVVDPSVKVKHPMVLWLHREGQEVKRAGFQQEAEALAVQGIASLLVELPFKQPFVHRSDNNAGDAESIRLAIVAARRALDWAATRSEYDMKKVAVVGHRFGAWAAALLTAVDARIDGALLMSPPGKPSGWLQVTEQPRAKAFRESFPKEAWGNYLNSIDPLDPEKWVRFAAPAKMHFQFASGDQWVQTLEQVDLFRATSRPKSRAMYEADELLNDEAKRDRASWLRATLRGK